MKKFWMIYKKSYMRRPTVSQTFIRCIIVLLLSFLWERFLDQGQRGVGFIMQILGVVFILLAWFHYLGLDGVHLTPPRRDSSDQQPKKKRFRMADMIDFTSEEVNPMEDLTRDEKSACHLLADLIVGAGFLIIGTVISLL